MRVRPFVRAVIGLSLAATLVLTASAVVSGGVSRAWTDQFGSSGIDVPTAVDVDRDRNVYVTGRIRSAASDDCFLRRYRPDGSRRWMRIFGTASGDYCHGVAVARGGAIYVAGHTNGALTGAGSAGGEDAFVRKLRPNGEHLWTQQQGSAGQELGRSLAVAGDGRIYLVGQVLGALPGQTTHGGTDGFVRKYRPNGRTIWTRQFGTPGFDWADEVSVDHKGRVYVTGRIIVTTADAFVMKMRPDGSLAWLRRTGTNSSGEEGRDVAIDKRRHVFLVGTTDDALAGQTALGDADAWIRKYRP